MKAPGAVLGMAAAGNAARAVSEMARITDVVRDGLRRPEMAEAVLSLATQHGDDGNNFLFLLVAFGRDKDPKWARCCVWAGSSVRATGPGRHSGMIHWLDEQHFGGRSCQKWADSGTCCSRPSTAP